MPGLLLTKEERTIACFKEVTVWLVFTESKMLSVVCVWIQWAKT